MIFSVRNRPIAATLGMILLAPAALAQNPAKDAQNKLLAKRAAEADCYRKLGETVYGLHLTSDTLVRDFVTESDQIRAGMDHFLKGIRLGPPRYYDDGTCEVDGEVDVAKLVTKIKELHATHYRGNVVTTTDIENVTKTVQTETIRATGSGVPRPDLPPNLPEGIEEVITPLPADVPITRNVPEIWKTVGPQGRLMAERAAELDGMRHLLEQIEGLRLNSETLVRDFVTESDEIRTRAEGLVVGASVASKYLHDDELIAEVTMEVPVEKIVTRIKELHAEHYRGNRVTTTDITNVKKSIEREMIRATGMGVPPARFLMAAKTSGIERPAWFTQRLAATGKGVDPEIQTAQGKLRAARAAELDAMRKLIEQIHGLTLAADKTVKDYLGENVEIRTQFEASLAGAVADAPVFTDDTASVTVSLSGANVWSVLHSYMMTVQRRG